MTASGPVEWDAVPALHPEVVREAVDEAAIHTPLLPAPGLARDGLPPILLKAENLQVTGSFKVRGAAARLSRLDGEERARGVVACSSGNHGRAVAYVAGRQGVSATICVPEWVDPVKREAMEAAGAEVILAGATYDQAEARAFRIRDQDGRVFVHPFDDPWVASGQGTLGLELLEDAPGLGGVVIPLSGGGLAAGVAYALKRRRPEIRVVAASARRARVMVESLGAGEPVSMEEEETLASALSGGIGRENRYTLELVRALVDDHVLVEEDEIAGAMTWAAREAHLVVEGGGAVGLAALRAGRLDRLLSGLDAPFAVVLSGGNVGLESLARLGREPAVSGP